MAGLYFLIAMLASHSTLGLGDLSSMDTNIEKTPAVRPEIVFGQTLDFKYSCPKDDHCENSVTEDVGRKALQDELEQQIQKSWLCYTDQHICSLKVKILHFDVFPHKHGYNDDESCKSRFCLEMTATYTFDLVATTQQFRDYDPVLARIITETEVLMNSFKEHFSLTLWLRQPGNTGRPMMFYLTSATAPHTVAEHGHIVKVDRTGRGFIYLKYQDWKCTTEGFKPIENEEQCHEAANSLSKKRRHTKKDNFGRHQSLQHRRGCFVSQGNLVTFNDYDDYDGSEYAVNGYGREICLIDAPAKTTAFRIPKTTNASNKAIVSVSSTSATAAPSTKVTVTSTKARVPPATFRVASTNRSAFSEQCRVCFVVCRAHCKSCDARDVEEVCRPYCAEQYGCPSNETAAALQHSENELSLSFDATVIVISVSCALVAIVGIIGFVASARRSSFCKTQVLHFESVDVVNGVEVVNNSRPSFDADEDWSVGMVMDELHIKMTESPLHRMIRKQRGRSISCGSEDMGRERQQGEKPELIPFHDWQTNGCHGTNHGTNDFPEETSNKTYASFDKYDQDLRTHYGSFDNNDEELRMDVDGRWYTRLEFQVEYGGLLQWNAAPRVGDVEDSEENDEVAISPSPPPALDEREVKLPAHSDNSDEEQSDPGDTASANHTATNDVKDDESASVNKCMVGRVAIGPASRNQNMRSVPKAKSDDAIDTHKYACNDPKASLNTRIKVASPKRDKYAVDVSSAVVIASTHKRDGDREDKYEVAVTVKDGTSAFLGTRTLNEVVRGPGTRSEKQIPAARKSNSDNAMDESKYASNAPRTKQMPAAPKPKSDIAMDEANESKYASTAPHTLLKARLQAARPKEDKYTVDVSSAPMISGCTANKVVASSGARSKKQIPAAPNCKSETNESKYAPNAPQTLLKARLQAARPKEDKYTVDVSSAPVISACAVEKVLPDARSKKQTPVHEVNSENNGSKYASNAPQTLLKAKLQAVQPKQDKYTVDVSSASVLAVHKQDGAREPDMHEVPKIDPPTTPAAAPPLSKQSSSKRMRRQRIPSSKRQSRRSRRKRNSREDDDQASRGATSDRYAIPKTKKITVGRARKQPDANANKYATTISVNRKVVAGTTQKKDRYHVDTPKRPSRDNNSRDRINKVTAMKATAASTQNAAKNQYTVDTRKVMPAVNRQNELKSSSKYTVQVCSQMKQAPCEPSTVDKYAVEASGAVNSKTALHRAAQTDEKHATEGIVRAQIAKVKAANSVLEKRDQYAVDTLPSKARPAHQHRPSEPRVKAVVVTNSQNDVGVSPNLATTVPTVDTHPLVPKVTKAAMIEAKDRYAVEATPVLAHKRAVKPSNDDGKYTVHSSRLKTATPNGTASDKATTGVAIKVGRELNGQQTKKVAGSGDNNGDKYAVSTSNKVRSVVKSKVAPNTAHERTEKKNLAGKDAHQDQATCKPVHAHSKKSDADKYAVKVDDKLAPTINTKAPVASKRALRRQRLRTIKRRRERRRRDRERWSRSSQDISSDKNNQTSERAVDEDSEKIDKRDSKSEIISVADETPV